MIAEPLSILLVEDNAGDAELTIARLSNALGADSRFTSADSLGAAAEQLAERDADVILVDLNLPDSTGVDTLSRIRALHPVAPVVVLSGTVDLATRARALELGAAEVISKDDVSSRLFPLSVLYVVHRHRAEERSRRIERFLEVSPDAIVVVDGPGRVRYVNEAALRLFGKTRAELEQELLAFAAQEGLPVELRVPHPASGTERYGEMRIVDFEWRGQRSTLASIRDVTEQRKLEMQLLLSDRMASIGTLAAGVAHEINNPLAAVVGNLEVALEELNDLAQSAAVPQSIVDELRDAREAAERVRQIVRDLKVFSRSEDERLGAVDIHRVLDSTLRMAWNEIRHRARLQKDFALPAPPPVHGNASRLGQVFLNLVINAAQAIKEGAVESNEVRVSTRCEQDGWVSVIIADTGHGIPPDVQPRLFTPFFTTKPIGEGTGLGLAICHRIVSNMGGTITFESKPGAGTTFTVRLPTVSDAVEPEPQVPRKSPAEGRRLRLLVIDDEAPVLKVLMRVLSPNHDVVAVRSGAAALGLLELGESFDVILCDLMMPEMTGADVYEKVKKWGRGIEERFVFMTGGAFTPGIRTFLDSVPNVRIEKPFDVDGLRAQIRSLAR